MSLGSVSWIFWSPAGPAIILTQLNVLSSISRWLNGRLRVMTMILSDPDGEFIFFWTISQYLGSGETGGRV